MLRGSKQLLFMKMIANVNFMNFKELQNSHPYGCNKHLT